MIETKSFPDNFNTPIVSNIKVSYSQTNEINENIDDVLKVTINNNGAGFYYVMKTDRWAFETFDDLIKVLQDFKEKAKI